MRGHAERLDELAGIEKHLDEMANAAACYSDPLAEVQKIVKERKEAVRKDRDTFNPMVPKGKEVYEE